MYIGAFRDVNNGGASRKYVRMCVRFRDDSASKCTGASKPPKQKNSLLICITPTFSHQCTRSLPLSLAPMDTYEMVSVACTYEISLRFEVSWLQPHECTDLSIKNEKSEMHNFSPIARIRKKGNNIHTNTHTTRLATSCTHASIGSFAFVQSFRRSCVRAPIGTAKSVCKRKR